MQARMLGELKFVPEAFRIFNTLPWSPCLPLWQAITTMQSITWARWAASRVRDEYEYLGQDDFCAPDFMAGANKRSAGLTRVTARACPQP